MKSLIKQTWNKIKPFHRNTILFLDILFLLIWIVNLWLALSSNSFLVYARQNLIVWLISAKMTTLLFYFLFIMKNKITNTFTLDFKIISWLIFLFLDLLLFAASLQNQNLKIFFVIVDLILIIFLFLNWDLSLIKYLNYAFKRHKVLFSIFILTILFNTTINSFIIFLFNQKNIPLNYSWIDIFLKIISSGLANDFEIPQSSSALFTMALVINSLCFFLFGLLFVQSITFTFKNRHKIFMSSHVKSYENKKIIFEYGILFSDLNNKKFIKEFSNQFLNYYNEVMETCMDDYLIFNKNDVDFQSFLNKIKEKIGNKTYNKYIQIKDQENQIIIMKKINWNITLSNKLAKLDFYKNFSSLYEIKIKNLDDTNVKQRIHNLISKYSVPCYIDKKNLSIKSHFSFKNCFENNIKMENFTDDKIARHYLFKLEDSNKNINMSILGEEFKNLLVKMPDLNLDDSSFQIKKSINQGFKISFYTHYQVDDKRQEINKLIDNLNEKNKWSLKMKKYKSCIEYWTDSEQEREQIFIKMNLYGNSLKLKKRKDGVEPTKINPKNTSNYLKKVIIRSNSESKLDQSFKNELFNFFELDNILDFEEKIYLNKNYFWELAKEKHSFQFILNTYSLNGNKLKQFEDLISKYNISYNKNKYWSKDKEDLEYTVLYLNPIERWN